MKNNSINYLLLFCYCAVFAQQPVNPKATQESKKLLQYIYNLDGKILSGQHSFNESPEHYYNKAHKITGEYPAVWGTDLYWSGKENPEDRIVKAALKKHEEGAIVTLMWHVGRPIDDTPYSWSDNVQNKLNNAEWNELITVGSEIHSKWLAQVDTIAKTLKKLQQAKIPILWRPYHEMNGVWFWWGNKPGKDGFVKLWKMLYDRLTQYHKINNLIWVWNANGPRDIPHDQAYAYADFYPGATYVDILAADVYHNDYEQKDYNELLELANGKPIALGEVGQLPTINILEEQPKWSWFMIWSNWLETANTPEHVKEIYKYPKTLSRGEIKK